MKKILAIMVLMSGTALAQNAPFGIAKNTTIQQLKQMGAEDRGSGVYRLDKVPQPNSAFDFYMVVASPTHGVCKITGIGKSFYGDSTGYQARSEFSKLKSALNSKYGSSEDFDYIKNSSIWDEYDDFAMSIKVEDRSLVSFWPKSESTVLPASIESIMLNTYALDSSTTYINVSYEFNNYDKCLAEIKGPVNRGL